MSLDKNDLDYYSIYRSENSEFEPSEETLIGYTTEDSYIDSSASAYVYYYYVINQL